MIIDYRDLHKHDGVQTLHDEISVSEIAESYSQVEAISPADVQIEAQLVDEMCTVQGRVKYSVTYVCTRCLESFVSEAETHLFEEFSEDEGQATEEIHLAPSGIVEFDPWVMQSIALDLEFFPVCKPDCRGLCPVCGVNRNNETCDCDVRTIDPRLAALSDLLSTDESE